MRLSACSVRRLLRWKMDAEEEEEGALEEVEDAVETGLEELEDIMRRTPSLTF